MALEYAKKYSDAVSHLVLLAMSPDGNPQSFELAKNLANLQEEIDANPIQAFITRALKFGPMIWYDENFDASNLWKDVKVNPEIMD